MGYRFAKCKVCVYALLKLNAPGWWVPFLMDYIFKKPSILKWNAPGEGRTV
jgi:hypothetical protein